MLTELLPSEARPLTLRPELHVEGGWPSTAIFKPELKFGPTIEKPGRDRYTIRIVVDYVQLLFTVMKNPPAMLPVANVWAEVVMRSM